MSRDWTQQKERGSVAALRLIRWIALTLGRPVARLFLHPITIYFLITGRRGKQASLTFARRVGRKPDIVWAYRHIFTFAASILDRVYFLSDRLEGFDIRMDTNPATEAFLDSEKPCLMLGSHLGSFDALRALALNQRGLPIKAMMHVNQNENMKAQLDAINPALKDSVIPLGQPTSLLKASQWVEEGGMIAVLGDRVGLTRDTARCNFLGERADFPTGSFRFAHALGLPIVTCYGLYEGGNRYRIRLRYFCDPIQATGKQRTAVYAELAQRYADDLAEVARSHPHNWFNFYDFWDGHAYDDPR